jgi:hypothetical protein
MKTHTAKSTVLSVRCAYRSVTGRQCRLHVFDKKSSLCPHHGAEQLQLEAADHYMHLIRNFQCFQTAQGINHSLSNLYELLAKNRISPRRAAVLSYISSLLLRTLPQIDVDRAAGIIDPTNPPLKIPAVNKTSDSVEFAKSQAETRTGNGPEPQAAIPPQLQSASTWDPSAPQPAHKPKPS